MIAFGDGGCVDVVLDRGLLAEEAAEVAEHGRPLPARQVRSQLESATTRLYNPRAADDGLEQRAAAVNANLVQELVCKSGELAYPSHTTRGAGGLASAGANRAGEVGNGPAHELPADVEP
jgi:hypothetical protein